MDERHESRRGTLRWRLAVLLVLTTLLGIAGTGGASAQEQDQPQDPPAARWAVQPSGPNGPGNRDWFIYTLKPGAVFGDTVAISNLSDRPIRFIVYAADVQGVANVGGLAAEREEVAPTDVGSWIELATNERTVEPGTRIDVPFSITVPEDAEPGDHVGAILAIDADEAVVGGDDSDGLGFQVRQRVGARVYVRVEGAQEPELTVTELSVDHDNPILPTGSKATVNFEIVNSGNLRLTPTATMKIKGFLGRTVKTVPMPTIPELLPGGNYVGTATIEDLPPLERFSVELEVDALEATTKRSTTFWPTPWLLLLLLVPVVWYAVRKWRRRARRAAAPPPPPPPVRDREPVGV